MPRAWRLMSRPEGLPGPENFELVRFASRPLQDGEVRVRNTWLSVDPAMRIRMKADTDGYQASFPLGEPLTGGAIGEVIETTSPDFAVGETVNHLLGWRDESISPAAA